MKRSAIQTRCGSRRLTRLRVMSEVRRTADSHQSESGAKPARSKKHRRDRGAWGGWRLDVWKCMIGNQGYHHPRPQSHAPRLVRIFPTQPLDHIPTIGSVDSAETAKYPAQTAQGFWACPRDRSPAMAQCLLRRTWADLLSLSPSTSGQFSMSTTDRKAGCVMWSTWLCGAEVQKARIHWVFSASNTT